MHRPQHRADKERNVGMFDKMVQKGKRMAVQYAKEQLAQRTGQQRQNRSQGYGQERGYNGGGYGYEQNRGYGQNRGYNDGGYGRSGSYGNEQYPPGPQQRAGAGRNSRDADQAAIAKYKYMLQTAPPQDMERAHAEAFNRLTPQQRAMLRDELNSQLPASERASSDRPETLARTATRAEVAQPGFMERILGRSGSGRGGGRLAAGAAGAAGGLGAGLLAGVAAGFVGSAIAGPLLEGFSGIGEGIAGAAEGFGDSVASAGEGFAENAGFGGLFGEGGAGGFFGDGAEGFGDWEI